MTSRIFLVGFMGSGKSTIGKILAQRLGYTFMDLDSYIEDIHNKSISQLFSSEAEHGFRLIEQRALHTLEDKINVVIACGGGTPCFFDNMSWMKSIGTVIFLHCSAASLFSRLKSEQAHRPLIRDFEPEALQDFISRKLEERLPFYIQSDIQVFEMKDKISTASYIIQGLSVE